MTSRRQGGKQIAEIAEHFGGRVALAELLGCSHENISQWIFRGWIPTESAHVIEALSNGAFKFECMPLKPEFLKRRAAAAAAALATADA